MTTYDKIDALEIAIAALSNEPQTAYNTAIAKHFLEEMLKGYNKQLNSEVTEAKRELIESTIGWAHTGKAEVIA